MSNQDRISAAMNQIKSALREHGYCELVDNLSHGATPEELHTLETVIGFALPMDLRELWSIHAGQRAENGCPIRDEEGNGFFGEMDFLSPMEAKGCNDLLDASLEFMRQIRSEEKVATDLLARGEVSSWRTDENDWLESGLRWSLPSGRASLRTKNILTGLLSTPKQAACSSTKRGTRA